MKSFKTFLINLDILIACECMFEGECLWCPPFSCCGDLNNRPTWCPLTEHDMGECAEKHKEEMDSLIMKATEKLGW